MTRNLSSACSSNFENLAWVAINSKEWILVPSQADLELIATYVDGQAIGVIAEINDELGSWLVNNVVEENHNKLF